MPAVTSTTSGGRLVLALFLFLLVLGMRGEVRAQVTANPERLRFECTFVDTDSSALVTVRSLDEPIIVRKFELDSTRAFFPPQGPRAEGDTILRNGARNYLVRFQPRTTGPSVDTLRIYYVRIGLGRRDTLAVPLFGTGVRAALTTPPRGGEFNSVAVDSTALRTIYFVNPLCRAIVLDTVVVDDHGSGAFRIVAAPIYPRRIGDGGRDSVVVAFTPGMLGPVGEDLKVRFNRGEEVRIDLAGTGIGSALAAYTRGIDFGRVPANGMSRVDYALFMNRGNAPLVIDSVWITGADTSRLHGIEGVAGRSVPPLRNGRDTASMLSIPLVFTPDTLPIDATLHIRSRGGDVADVRVVGAVTGDIRLFPNSIRFDQVPFDSTLTFDSVTIINNESSPLTVDAIIWEGADSAVFSLPNMPPVPFQVAPNGQRGFKVAFTPGAARSEYAARVFLRRSNGGSGGGDRLRLDLLGNARPPRPELEWVGGDDPVDFGRVPLGVVGAPRPFILVNSGELPARIEGAMLRGRDSTDYLLLDSIKSHQLQPGARDTFWVAFAPQGPLRLAPDERRATLVVDGEPRPSERLMHGEVLRDGPLVEPRRLDFDSVLVNSADTLFDTVRVIAGPGGLHILGTELRGPDSSAFGVLRAFDSTVSQSEETSLTLVFRPSEVRDYRSLLVLRLDGGSQIRVLLVGRGVASVRGTRVVWIDQTSVNVNDPFVLRVHVAPALVANNNVQHFSARIVADRRALHLLGSDDPAVTVVAHDDTLLVERTGLPITGDILATLRFEGLVTGQPSNTVALRSVTLEPLDDSLQRLDGLVLLNGCDIGRGVLFGRSARVVSITPQPVGSVAALRYVAPEGSRPTVMVIDAAGQLRERIELPDGTGAEQSGEVRLNDLPSGLYLLELRVGSQRSSVSVLVTGE